MRVGRREAGGRGEISLNPKYMALGTGLSHAVYVSEFKVTAVCSDELSWFMIDLEIVYSIVEFFQKL